MGRLIFYHISRIHMEILGQKGLIQDPQKMGRGLSRPSAPMVVTYLICVEPLARPEELEAWAEERAAIERVIQGAAPKVQGTGDAVSVISDVYRAVVAAFPDRKSQLSGLDAFAEYVPGGEDEEPVGDSVMSREGVLNFPGAPIA